MRRHKVSHQWCKAQTGRQPSPLETLINTGGTTRLVKVECYNSFFLGIITQIIGKMESIYFHLAQGYYSLWAKVISLTGVGLDVNLLTLIWRNYSSENSNVKSLCSRVISALPLSYIWRWDKPLKPINGDCRNYFRTNVHWPKGKVNYSILPKSACQDNTLYVKEQHLGSLFE